MRLEVTEYDADAMHACMCVCVCVCVFVCVCVCVSPVMQVREHHRRYLRVVYAVAQLAAQLRHLGPAPVTHQLHCNLSTTLTYMSAQW